MMKQILTIIALFMSVSLMAQIKPAAKGVTYGANITAKGAITVDKMEDKLTNAEQYKGKVKGVITGVCEKRVAG